MKNVIETLEFDKVLNYISEYAISEIGKEFCVNATVFHDVSKIKYELQLTNEAKQILDKIFDVSDFPLENIFDTDKIINQSFSEIDIDGILKVAKNLRCARWVSTFLEKNSDNLPTLYKFKEKLFVNKNFEDKIENTFDIAGDVKDSASIELKNLRRSKKDTENNIKTEVSRLLQSSSFTQHLQDTLYTLRDERVVFQVKAEAKNKISGIVHDVSSTGQTFFIEPKELVGINNRLKEINIKIQGEIDRIISTLSQEIFNFAEELSISTTTLAECDFIFARAKYANKTNSCMPKIAEEKIITLKGMKNPVLQKVTDKIVENDFAIGEDYKSLVISGSNTGGKTVVLKTIGLAILMAKAGLFVPAYEAKIYPFKKVYAEIGDNQNIIQSLSTFSSHMKDLIEIIDNADEETLVLIDEITAGTDPKEGVAIAQVLLNYLYEKNAISVITTHYSELKSLAYQNNEFENASVEFDTATLKPTYRLAIGLPGASHALEIANNLGLKSELVEKAKEIYYTQKDVTAEILLQMQKTQSELTQAKEKIKKEQIEIEELEKEYEKQIVELKKEKKRSLQIYKKKYETQIETTRDEIKNIMKAVREEKSEKIAQRSFQKLADIEKNVRDDFSQEESELTHNYKNIDWQNAKIGDKFLVRGLNQEVKLLTLPDKNKNVQVLMGMLKSTMKMNKLAQFEKKFVNKSIDNSKYKKHFEYQKQELSHTLDLRGKRAEETLDEIELYIDKASLINLTPVYIIHGHGTGVLKQIVRDYLKTSPYVKKFAPASSAEGGDGVTVVDLL